MPLYDYQCPECGTVEEIMHSITSEDKVICKQCGSEMKKQFSSTQNFRFFGGGTYISHSKKDFGNG